MLRVNALTRAAAGAVQASSGKHVAHLTRTLNHLSLSSKLAPVSPLSLLTARFLATKVVKKKTATKVKPKAKTPVKKKAPAKKPVKKATAKKPAAKKKKAPVVKKKKVVAKKPKKKVLTELQKAKIEAKKEAVKAREQTKKAKNKEKEKAVKARDDIEELKNIALLGTKPDTLPTTPWQVFLQETFQKGASIRSGIMPIKSQEYKKLSESEVERYDQIAANNRAANNQAYKAWVQSHTPEQIRLANLARSNLKRQAAKGVPGTRKGMKGLTPIIDDRAPKRPVLAYMQFNIERQARGDMDGLPVGERAKLISQEWKALDPAKVKKYVDLSEAEIARYAREYQAAFGHPSPRSSLNK